MNSVTYTKSAAKAGRGEGNANKPFETFEDLETYKAAREFRTSMYGVTRKLPAFEKFELASQIRRAGVSLTNNIAEGHGRFHFLDQIKFMLQARGSLQELIDDLNVCDDESYLPKPEIAGLKQQGWQALRLLNGYLRWLRNQKADQKANQAHILHDAIIVPRDTDDDLKSWLASLPL